MVPCWRSARPEGRINPSAWSATLSDRVDCYWSLHSVSRQGFHYSVMLLFGISLILDISAKLVTVDEQADDEIVPLHGL